MMNQNAQSLFKKENQQLNSEISYITVYKSIYILSNFFAFLYGIMWSDLSYLPKHHSTPIYSFEDCKNFQQKNLHYNRRKYL